MVFSSENPTHTCKDAGQLRSESLEASYKMIITHNFSFFKNILSRSFSTF